MNEPTVLQALFPEVQPGDAIAAFLHFRDGQPHALKMSGYPTEAGADGLLHWDRVLLHVARALTNWPGRHFMQFIDVCELPEEQYYRVIQAMGLARGIAVVQVLHGPTAGADG